MIHLLLLVSRQGKVRLTQFYDEMSTLPKKDKLRVVREVTAQILARGPKMCNFVEFKGKMIVYKRYASLYFCCVVDADSNVLETLESIHHFVECLDSLFQNVCELDIIFNFPQAYWSLSECILGGAMVETSKREVLRVCQSQDEAMEDDEGFTIARAVATRGG